MIKKILNALNSQSPSVQELDDIRFTTATIDVENNRLLLSFRILRIS